MKKVFLVLLFSITATTMNSQDFEDVIKAGSEDASTYLGNYLEPVFKGLLYDMSSGWYHTGKTHNKFGLDISINASVAFVPEDEKNFVFNNADYQVLKLASGASSGELPTFMGNESNKQLSVTIPITITNPNTGLQEQVFQTTAFETMDGYTKKIADYTNGYSGVPLPMVQLGFGLLKRTDIKVRYLPETENEGVTVNLLGVGVQHDILQHFRKKLNKLDISLLGAFTKSTIVYAPKDGTYGVNQEVILDFSSYTAQILANLDLKYFDFYAGFGYIKGDSSMKVNGSYSYTYEIKDSSGNSIPNVPDQTLTLHDPIDIDYEISGTKATVGVRMNIGFIKIFADYSFQGYDTANVGVAFSFDKKKRQREVDEDKKEELKEEIKEELKEELKQEVNEEDNK